jgi:hypothetical protein
VAALTVVELDEPSRVGTLTRRLNLNEADQRIGVAPGKVWPCLQVGESSIAD